MNTVQWNGYSWVNCDENNVTEWVRNTFDKCSVTEWVMPGLTVVNAELRNGLRLG